MTTLEMVNHGPGDTGRSAAIARANSATLAAVVIESRGSYYSEGRDDAFLRSWERIVHRNQHCED